jgi:UDP-3-O-[3-hydroxymyristoyl] glucosamine N-acyltransferase
VLHTGARVSHGGNVRDSVVGAFAVLKPDVSLSAETIIGAGATVASGTRISGGRVPAERE